MQEVINQKPNTPDQSDAIPVHNLVQSRFDPYKDAGEFGNFTNFLRGIVNEAEFRLQARESLEGWARTGSDESGLGGVMRRLPDSVKNVLLGLSVIVAIFRGGIGDLTRAATTQTVPNNAGVVALAIAGVDNKDNQEDGGAGEDGEDDDPSDGPEKLPGDRYGRYNVYIPLVTKPEQKIWQNMNRTNGGEAVVDPANFSDILRSIRWQQGLDPNKFARIIPNEGIERGVQVYLTDNFKANKQIMMAPVLNIEAIDYLEVRFGNNRWGPTELQPVNGGGGGDDSQKTEQALPLLVFGPPGWVAFAIVGVIVVGGSYYVMISQQEETFKDFGPTFYNLDESATYDYYGDLVSQFDKLPAEISQYELAARYAEYNLQQAIYSSILVQVANEDPDIRSILEAARLGHLPPWMPDEYWEKMKGLSEGKYEGRTPGKFAPRTPEPNQHPGERLPDENTRFGEYLKQRNGGLDGHIGRGHPRGFEEGLRKMHYYILFFANLWSHFWKGTPPPRCFQSTDGKKSIWVFENVKTMTGSNGTGYLVQQFPYPDTVFSNVVKDPVTNKLMTNWKNLDDVEIDMFRQFVEVECPSKSGWVQILKKIFGIDDTFFPPGMRPASMSFSRKTPNVLSQHDRYIGPVRRFSGNPKKLGREGRSKRY